MKNIYTKIKSLLSLIFKLSNYQIVKLFIIVILANAPITTFAQDSSRIRISLLTCTPGDELYSIFGHSALRVIDSNSVTDIVYNYGTFNFDDEGFYLKFIRGKLLYYVSIAHFEDFKYEYQSSNRGMTEQLLNFSATEKINIQHALIENLKEENKYYQYDFFFDNCTTRLRDLIVKSKQPTPLLPSVKPADMRFRQAIHEYLDKGDQQWSKLGIDILLGAPTDKIMTASDQQFLPDNLMTALDSTKNTPLVISSQNLYELNAATGNKSFFTPMVFFLSLLAGFTLLHFALQKKLPLVLSGLDGILFFSTGLLGILLVFMWTATDHSMTKNNYNLLWALPTHLIISFFITSNKSWVKKYFLFTAIAGVLVLLIWFFLPQQLNISLIPFVVLIIFRALVIYFRMHLQKKISRL
ncbi:MAG TPA: DUF4105 domain-containing protein [Ferruginibacter sp.]|nr:DUF4105 domain-containing protein [Ferruginibacter sp.]